VRLPPIPIFALFRHSGPIFRCRSSGYIGSDRRAIRTTQLAISDLVVGGERPLRAKSGPLARPAFVRHAGHVTVFVASFARYAVLIVVRIAVPRQTAASSPS